MSNVEIIPLSIKSDWWRTRLRPVARRSRRVTNITPDPTFEKPLAAVACKLLILGFRINPSKASINR